MKNSFLFLYILISLFSLGITKSSLSQNVGIGTESPHPKAILEVKTTEKGVLFPRLTSTQRNAITNAPNGLHIYNTDESCLNYYDSAFAAWNCYCETDTCKIATVRIPSGCSVDFYNVYGNKFPSIRKFVLLIEAGTTLSCGSAGFGALSFFSMPAIGTYTITIINRGIILGAGGVGGAGATGQVGSCYRFATSGSPGGDAIATRSNVNISVVNYGLIAAGGGGGGGGGGTTNGQFGGGGGGGAGTGPGNGGTGGGNTFNGPFGSCGTSANIAQSGTVGQTTIGGGGETGSNGGNGGTGGARAMPGQPGTGTSPGAGGAAGKAIAGGVGNSIVNVGGGQSFGIVD